MIAYFVYFYLLIGALVTMFAARQIIKKGSEVAKVVWLLIFIWFPFAVVYLNKIKPDWETLIECFLDGSTKGKK